MLAAFRHRLWWSRLREQLWFRPAVWSLAAIGAALIAAAANEFVPPGLLPDIAHDTLSGLLSIIAASMLTVSTFSLSILVSAYASASSTATPRATRLVMADNDAQNAIAAFVSAFIFSIIALAALGVRYYGAAGRFVLFVFTLCVLAYLILALLRWIGTLSTLGRMNHTIETVERVATQAVRDWCAAPGLGARLVAEAGPRAPGAPIHAPWTGYLQHIDVAGIDAAAKAAGASVHVCVRPGTFVSHQTVLARVMHASRGPDGPEDLRAQVAGAFVIGRERTERQDPRFGLVMLSEIAQRALSPAVNDAGTAIAVLGAMARVLVEGTRRRENDDEAPSEAVVEAAHVTIAPLDPADLVRDVIEPIARDGAASIEVALRIQKLLALVAANTEGALRAAACAAAGNARDHALEGLRLERERALLRAHAPKL
ncbi:putative membrane protein [Variovorax sp. TBS-050B]|uniref:DUF2254 domain-containing protein n=1 Tax=Variovorax sp. TBS-050B TaxID=2940551 RepID=UPI002474959E|nr:DUF2254 domain-containing protein [Variovorax sp. TBS-050B]MDH6591870.1 putative membrane protein [Variovorax sp. TBS-050B]